MSLAILLHNIQRLIIRGCGLFSQPRYILGGFIKMAANKKRRDLTDKKFGYLTVIKLTDKKKGGRGDLLWDCVCVCGKHTFLTAHKLVANYTKSCGCKNRCRTPRTGGRSKTWYCWRAILERCSNLCDKRFSKHYFEKGITLDPRWLDFDNFVQDMGYCPDNLTIDRIDNDGGYTKTNCRWATYKQQTQNSSRHMRKNSTSTYKGVVKTKSNKYQVTCNQKYLGIFEDELSAATAYNIQALIEYGEYAYLNIIVKRSKAEMGGE